MGLSRKTVGRKKGAMKISGGRKKQFWQKIGMVVFFIAAVFAIVFLPRIFRHRTQSEISGEKYLKQICEDYHLNLGEYYITAFDFVLPDSEEKRAFYFSITISENAPVLEKLEMENGVYNGKFERTVEDAWKKVQNHLSRKTEWVGFVYPYRWCLLKNVSGEQMAVWYQTTRHSIHLFLWEE